jgi:nitroreductase
MNPLRAYHEASKHHPHRYAPGPGGLDWASQPDPFRRYEGAPGLDLPLLEEDLPPRWDDILSGRIPPAPLCLENLAVVLQLSLGLSAWKTFDANRWALRCNPSSGNLHPTEAYLVTAELPGLPAGVYHYRPDLHALEQRACLSITPPAGALIALTGIHWREAWKYGMRAFRYCQHDCGHALGALAYAAATLGWQAQRLSNWSDNEIAALTGIARDEDFIDAESEAPEALIWIGTGDAPRSEDLLALIAKAQWAGRANALSPYHVDWPEIPQVATASSQPAATAEAVVTQPMLPALPSTEPWAATQLIRQRRSAQAFDGCTDLSRNAFLRMLDALLPRAGLAPWSVLPQEPQVHPVFFVHRVEGLAPGIYCLPRSPRAAMELRNALRPDWLWEHLPDCPEHLPLFLLAQLDVADFAAAVSCHQDIAADSAFSLAMLARFDDIDAAHGWRYRQRFWEAGLLGQVLYLEAEAAGVQGTGIGCYFDDEVHRALGVDTQRFQDIYHFTVGTAVIDTRLDTEPAYAHLAASRRRIAAT